MGAAPRLFLVRKPLYRSPDGAMGPGRGWSGRSTETAGGRTPRRRCSPLRRARPPGVSARLAFTLAYPLRPRGPNGPIPIPSRRKAPPSHGSGALSSLLCFPAWSRDPAQRSGSRSCLNRGASGLPCRASTSVAAAELAPSAAKRRTEFGSSGTFLFLPGEVSGFGITDVRSAAPSRAAAPRDAPSRLVVPGSRRCSA